MNHSPDSTFLMHAVLDGVATPAQAGELAAILAAAPGAQAQFDELKRLFDELGRVPMAPAPDGLLDAVMASVTAPPVRRGVGRQLFGRPRVIREESKETPGLSPGQSATIHRVPQRDPYTRGHIMSEQQNGSTGNRKVWIGAGIAAAAAIVAVALGIDFPPGSTDTAGTIVPAQRYRAPQITSDDVKLGDPSAATQPTQTPTFPTAAAASQADSAAKSAADSTAKSAADNAAKSSVNGAAKSAADSAAKSAATIYHTIF